MLHTPAGPASLTLRLAGVHNVRNALAATACALAAGAPLAAVRHGLEAFVPVKGRSQLKSATLHGVRIALVDDSYNANPDSVRAAIDVLAAMHAPRLLVLGDMGEVGDRGRRSTPRSGPMRASAASSTCGVPVRRAAMPRRRSAPRRGTSPTCRR